MKVLLVTEYFPPKVFGGGELSSELLAKGLAEKNIKVSVLTSHFKDLKKYEEKENYKIYRLLKTGNSPTGFISNVKRTTKFPLIVKKQVKKLDKKHNFDIIHCLNNSSIEGVSYANLNKKLVATINSYVLLCPKANLFYKEKKACNGCNTLKYLHCILQSDYIGKQKLKYYLKYNPLFLGYIYGNYLKNIRLLKNFNILCRSSFILDFIKSKKLTNKKTGTEYNIFEPPKKIIKYKKIEKQIKNNTVITFIGGLEKIKGVSSLIKAYKKVKNKKNSRLLIVGKGSLKKKLIELSRKLRIKNRIIFTGKIDYRYIPYIYKKTDIIAMLTRWPEPFSRVITEALYFKKPVIATNTGGNPDAVINKKNGFLVKNNISEISERLELLINNEKTRKAFGKEARKIFNRKFKKNITLNNIIEFYRKI